ncbi:MAG: hypothetical protein LBJ64_01575, partial [Deltaproteobacteria bacterium]|nr:hypothetical protein [Deltaproteobacteria bacterium]
TLTIEAGFLASNLSKRRLSAPKNLTSKLSACRKPEDEKFHQIFSIFKNILHKMIKYVKTVDHNIFNQKKIQSHRGGTLPRNFCLNRRFALACPRRPISLSLWPGY